jgi:hypothetical protein
MDDSTNCNVLVSWFLNIEGFQMERMGISEHGRNKMSIALGSYSVWAHDMFLLAW